MATTPKPATGAQTVPVTVNNFIQAESHYYLGNALSVAGAIGKLGHHRVLMPVEARIVVRPNRDTFYSPAVVDFDAGPVTVTLPDVGKRFRAMQVINEDEWVVGPVVYDAGTYAYERKQVGTRYALVAVRIFGDPNDPEDVKQVHALQDATKLSQPQGPGRWEIPNWDQDSRVKVHNALLALAAGIPDFRKSFGYPDAVDPIQRLLGAAAAWGGNPDKDAIYLNFTPERNDGKTVYKLTIKDVPVDAFWSVSLYNADGFFQKNEYDAYSLNNVTAKKDADGSVRIQFGGCDGKVPNCLPIMPGWNYMVRLYRPRKEILDGSFKFPEAQPVS